MKKIEELLNQKKTKLHGDIFFLADAFLSSQFLKKYFPKSISKSNWAVEVIKSNIGKQVQYEIYESYFIQKKEDVKNIEKYYKYHLLVYEITTLELTHYVCKVDIWKFQKNKKPTQLVSFLTNYETFLKQCKYNFRIIGNKKPETKYTWG